VTYLKVVNVPPIPADPMWEGILVEVEVAAGAVEVCAVADTALPVADNQCGAALEPGEYPLVGETEGGKDVSDQFLVLLVWVKQTVEYRS